MLKKIFRRRKKNYEYDMSDSSDSYVPLEEEQADIYSQIFKRQQSERAHRNAKEQLNASQNKHRKRVDKRYLVELCEHLIETTKELEDIKHEYNIVTSYLNDIQILENLSETKRRVINETAKMILNLDTVRSQFLQADHKLSDVQFSQLQEEEDELPAAIRRLQANEAYLDAIRRDMNLL